METVRPATDGDVENLLDKVPYRRKKGRAIGGRIHIVMPKYPEGWRKRSARALGLPVKVTVHLDGRSSRVWGLIDGKRTVEEIGALMRERYGEKIEPVYGRLGTLLMIMERNGLIGYREKRGTERHERIRGVGTGNHLRTGDPPPPGSK